MILFHMMATELPQSEKLSVRTSERNNRVEELLRRTDAVLVGSRGLTKIERNCKETEVREVAANVERKQREQIACFEAEIVRLKIEVEAERKKLEADIVCLTEAGRKQKEDAEAERKKLEADIVCLIEAGRKQKEDAEVERKKLEAEIVRLTEAGRKQKEDAEAERKKLEAEIARLTSEEAFIVVS